MRRSVCVQIALILTCLVYLIVNGTTIIQIIFPNTEKTSRENINDYLYKSKSDQEVLKNNSKTKENGHINDYLENLTQHSKNLISKDCQKWNKIDTPSHKYSLPVNALNSEDAERASNEEDDAHRVKSFEKIFETNAWGQSKSGPGSLIPATGRIRNVLDSVIEETKKYLNKDKIRLISGVTMSATPIFNDNFRFLDSSCGDMVWMPEFLSNRSDIIFTGFDIVKSNINNHKERFNDRPWTFETHDIVTDVLNTSYDLILSRHTTQHLQTEDVVKVIKNFITSKSRFLITTNFPNIKVSK